MHFFYRHKYVLIPLMVCFFTSLLFIAGFFLFVSYINIKQPNIIAEADGIVVLTGGPARIEQAVKLLADGKGKRLLISGVHPSTSKRDLRKLVPQHADMFNCCIDIDHIATNTIGNASQTKNWVGSKQFSSVIVVTASYHMPRSLVELRRAMPYTKLIPCPVKVNHVHMDAWWEYPGTLALLVKEYLKVIAATLRLGVTQMVYYVMPPSSSSV